MPRVEQTGRHRAAHAAHAYKTESLWSGHSWLAGWLVRSCVVGSSTTNYPTIQLSLNEWIGDVCGSRDPDALHLQVFLDHLLTALAAKPRSLVSPERRQI